MVIYQYRTMEMTLNSLEKFDNLFREQLDKIKNINKGNNPPPPLIHVLGDFNFILYGRTDSANLGHH